MFEVPAFTLIEGFDGVFVSGVRETRGLSQYQIASILSIGTSNEEIGWRPPATEGAGSQPYKTPSVQSVIRIACAL